MHKGQIISNYKFFRLEELEGVQNGLHCTIDNSRFTIKSPQGKWYYPNGMEVPCDSQSNDSGPLHCRLSSDAKSVILYAKSHPKLDLTSPSWIGAYSCCLPDLCDSGNSSRVTARIYGEFMSMLVNNREVSLIKAFVYFSIQLVTLSQIYPSFCHHHLRVYHNSIPFTASTKYPLRSLKSSLRWIHLVTLV